MVSELGLYDIYRASIARCLDLVQGLKVIVMDALTSFELSMAFSQRMFLESEITLSIFLEQLADTDPKGCPSVPAVVFFFANEANIVMLERELAQPRFQSYALFFMGKMNKSYLDRLARADTHKCVTLLQNIFCDFTPRSPGVFVSRLDSSGLVPRADEFLVESTVDTIIAVLMSLGVRPQCIRRDISSERAAKVAGAVQNKILQVQDGYLPARSLAESRALGGREGCSGNPLTLLIVDRLSDVVTPLLPCWTFEGAVATAFGPLDGRVVRVGQRTIPFTNHDGLFPRMRLLSVPAATSLILELNERQQAAAQRSREARDLQSKMGAMLQTQQSKEVVRSYETIMLATSAALNYRGLPGLGSSLAQALAGRKELVMSFADELGRTAVTDSDMALIASAVAGQAVLSYDADLVRQGRAAGATKLTKTAEAFMSRLQKAAQAASRSRRPQDDQTQDMPEGQTERTTTEHNWELVMNAARAATRVQHSHSQINWQTVASSARMRENVIGDKDTAPFFARVPPFVQAAASCINGTLPASEFVVSNGDEAVSTRPSDVLLFVVGGLAQDEMAWADAYDRALRPSPSSRRRLFCGSETILTASDWLSRLQKLAVES